MSSQAPSASLAGLNPDILWRVVGDEALLLDIISGNYFSLDRVATEIWLGLTKGESHEEIAVAVARRYSIDASQVAADISDLMSDLRDAGIWR